jgi:probable rRNA maturation factor
MPKEPAARKEARGTPALEQRQPTISLRNLQRRVPLDLKWLRRFATVALEESLDVCHDGQFALRALDEVSVAIVSDQRIAQIHDEFMDIEGPTDVITFEHGDIVISAETALAYGATYRQPVDREVALYIVHGLLHLNGFDDLEPKAHRLMHATQDRVMRACLRRISAD